MSVEQQMRELLRLVTPHPEAAIDVDQVRRGARRRRSLRTALTVGLVAVLIGGGLSVALVIDRDAPQEPAPKPAPEAMVWMQAPDMPLSPRRDPLTVWTGNEALVIGGSGSDVVGGPLMIATLKDGAAYDPTTESWRRIADAPAAVGSRSSGPRILVGDTLVVTQGHGWLAYDIGGDSWRTLPNPPEEMPQPTLAADPASGLVYAVDRYFVESEAPVQVLDVRRGTWSALPPSTNTPRLDELSLVMTGAGLVLVGNDLHPRQAGDALEVSRAELWNGKSWMRYPDSDVNGDLWLWTGERIISALRRTEREADPDKRYPYTAGALDPETGRWAALPPRPGLGGGLLASGWPPTDGPQVFQDGYLYDDSDGSSAPVRSPDASLAESAVLLGGGWLMTFGGYNFDPGQEQSRYFTVTPTNETWVMAVH